MSFNGPPSFTIPPSVSATTASETSGEEHPYDGPPSLTYGRGTQSFIEENITEQETPTDFDYSRIPLKDIMKATNNFAEDNIIEKDYGWIVYNGELSGKKLAFVLFNEGYMLNTGHVFTHSSLPKHQNIVSLIGICDDDGRVILVLEHPTHGELYKYVSSPHLTWLMRVKICLDIASGLHYIQDYRKTHEMKIEDLNIECIHLDENWQAKIQLFKPSSLIEQPQSFSTVGQLGYFDPLYRLTEKQSEIYNFGVILFELLCARPAVTSDEEGGTQFLRKLACSHYEKGTLTGIIDPVLREQMNRDSMAIFSEVAYRCLNEDPSIRPAIWVVIDQLEKVLKLQEGSVTSEHQQVS